MHHSRESGSRRGGLRTKGRKRRLAFCSQTFSKAIFSIEAPVDSATLLSGETFLKKRE
jgi:hypothetical protein